MLKFAMLLAVSIAGTSLAQAQLPSMQELARNVDQAASQLSARQNSFLGFKKLEMPKPLAGLLDVRFKKPEFPKLALLEKLKNIGKPNFDASGPATQGPIMAGLSKLFPSRTSTTPSLLDRMLGKSSQPEIGNSLFNNGDLDELTKATRGLQDHVGRMSRDVQTNATELFSGQNALTSPQPPLRSARQYSGQSQSRY